MWTINDDTIVLGLSDVHLGVYINHHSLLIMYLDKILRLCPFCHNNYNYTLSNCKKQKKNINYSEDLIYLKVNVCHHVYSSIS